MLFLESDVFCPLVLSFMTPLSFWSNPFTLTGRDETLTYQVLSVWSIQVDFHQVTLTKIHSFQSVCSWICLSVWLWLVGCWVEVPVTSGSVCSQSWDRSLIHMPLLKHTPLKSVIAVSVHVFVIIHLIVCTINLLRMLELALQCHTVQRWTSAIFLHSTGNDDWTGLDKRLTGYKRQHF